MPGFVLVENNLKNNFQNYNCNKKSLLLEIIELENLSIQRRTINKFLNDKVFYENKDFMILTEGIIFNKIDLIKKNKKINFQDTIIEMYKENGEQFFNKFRGSFSGILIDKKNKITIIYTDQTGSKQIFYYKNFENIIIGSSINYILEIIKLNKINYSFNKKGAYCLLNHGFMLENITVIEEIKKLVAGTYLKIKNKKVEIIEYHKFSNTPNRELDDNEIINRIDLLFLEALKKQINKNKEYGYENYAPLSAGLDSRIVNFGFEKLKIKNVKNITYSQTGYHDELIPKKIANDLKRHWIFKSLDNGLSIKDNIDEIININDGQVLYYGPGQVNDIFENLNDNKLGVIHTGMLGDVVVGTFFKEKNQELKFNVIDGAYSKKLIDKLKKNLELKDIRSYQNQEIYNFYNRGFNGANLGSPLTFQEKTESYSPFYDVDFLEFCLTIPVEKRWNNYIYDKWVITKYPDATNYLHNGIRKIGEQSVNINIFGREIKVKEIIPKGIKYVFKKIGILNTQLNTKNHMNPLDYWYNNNLELKNYLNNYFDENIEKIKDKELKEDCIYLYKKGNTIEKTQVLTLLGIFKKYF